MGHRTFAEMLEAIKQHTDGLVSDAELIQVLQCDKFQFAALCQYNALPPAVTFKCSLADFDLSVQQSRDRAASFGRPDAGQGLHEQWPLDQEDDDNHEPLQPGSAS